MTTLFMNFLKWLAWFKNKCCRQILINKDIYFSLFELQTHITDSGNNSRNPMAEFFASNPSTEECIGHVSKCIWINIGNATKDKLICCSGSLGNATKVKLICCSGSLGNATKVKQICCSGSLGNATKDKLICCSRSFGNAAKDKQMFFWFTWEHYKRQTDLLFWTTWEHYKRQADLFS